MRRPVNPNLPTMEPTIYCSDCKEWIKLPYRWARNNFENHHIRKLHPARWKQIQDSREKRDKEAEASTWTLDT